MLAAVQETDEVGTTMETHHARYFPGIRADPTIDSHFTEEVTEAPF